MLEAAEIARFKISLDCSSPLCDWYEDKDGVAWCEVCGSGFLPSARVFLRRSSRNTEPPLASSIGAPAEGGNGEY